MNEQQAQEAIELLRAILEQLKTISVEVKCLGDEFSSVVYGSGGVPYIRAHD